MEWFHKLGLHAVVLHRFGENGPAGHVRARRSGSRHDAHWCVASNFFPIAAEARNPAHETLSAFLCSGAGHAPRAPPMDSPTVALAGASPRNLVAPPNTMVRWKALVQRSMSSPPSLRGATARPTRICFRHARHVIGTLTTPSRLVRCFCRFGPGANPSQLMRSLRLAKP